MGPFSLMGSQRPAKKAHARRAISAQKGHEEGKGQEENFPSCLWFRLE